MQDVQSRLPEINALEAQAFQAAQTGRDAEAQRLWARILELDPNHVRTLSFLGQRAFRAGDMSSARVAFQRIVDIDGSDPQQWIHLAIACRNLKDEPAEENAIRQALTRDPGELRQPHSSGQPARATRPDARGGRRLQCGRRRGAAARPPASRASSGGRRGERACRKIQSRSRGIPRPVPRHPLQDVRGRGPQTVSRFGRHHGRPEATLRIAFDDLPLRGPGPDRILRPRAVSVAGSVRGRDRPDSHGVPERPRDRGRFHALHLLPAGRTATPVRRAQQLSALERVPPLQDGEARRGERRPVPAHDGAARGARRSPTSLAARRRRCSRS